MTDTKTYDLDDDRLRSYCNAVAANHDFGKTTSGRTQATAALRNEGYDCEEIASWTRDYAGIRGGQTVTVYEYTSPNGRGTNYLAEWTERVAIDDVVFASYAFTSEPTKEDVRTIELLEQLVRKIVYEGLPTTFDCWECGSETHVLDADRQERSGIPKLRRIVDAAEDRYCHNC